MQYKFLPANQKHGRASVCIDELYDDDSGNIIYMAGITYCSPKDQFSYARGRVKSLARLRQGTYKGIFAMAPNGKHFFSMPVNEYSREAETVGGPYKLFEQALMRHVDTFVAAANKGNASAMELG